MKTTFEVLAEPIRRRILDLLLAQPRLVSELAELLDISQPAISKHLRLLLEVGLVRVRQKDQRHWYELEPAALATVDEWLKAYRHIWDVQFNRLDDYLQELQTKDGN